MDKPVTLTNLTIEPKINEEAITFLKSIEGEISVIAITGLYRCGKSYILNQLIDRPQSFKVGHTMDAQT